MSSNKYVTPLRLDLKSSRILFIFILASHGLAYISIWLLPLWAAVVMAIAISLSLILSLKQQGYLSGSHAIDRLVLGTDNLWTITRRDGTKSIAQLKSETYVSPYVVILCLAAEHAWVAHKVVILPDATDKDAFRRLRVHLNTQG